MIKSIFNISRSPNILEQVVTDVIKAVAIEEKALSNILNLEHEIIQKAKNDSVNLEEFVSINESVNSIIRNISRVQNLTQLKLQHIKEVIQKLKNLYENDDPEE